MNDVNFKETIDELNNCSTNTPLFDTSFDNTIHLSKIVYCYDGDTVHCVFKHDDRYQKFIIRMYGYDSAEMKQSRALDENIRKKEKEKAISAKKRLDELILNKIVYIFCKKMDKYGRLLAEIKLKLNDKKSINDIMIEEGHGYKYYGGTKKNVKI